MTVWRLRAWDDESLQDHWLTHGVIAVGDARDVDMTDHPSRDEIKRRLRAVHPDASERTIGVWGGYWHAFLSIVPGELVVVPLSHGQLAVGEVLGEYVCVPDETNPRLRNRMPVRWLVTDLDRAAVDDDIRKTVNAQGTICRVKAPDAERRLRSLAPGVN